MSDVAAGICAVLISERLVHRDDLPELESDPGLRDDVSRRLQDTGLVLLERPGVPYLGVAVAGTYRDAVSWTDQGIHTRTLGLLLYVWLQLVGRFLYGDDETAGDPADSTVSEGALLRDLPGQWSKTSLRGEATRLSRLGFLDKVRGEYAWLAGPMLWLAVDHDTLLQLLRKEKGLPKAVERYMRDEGIAPVESK